MTSEPLSSAIFLRRDLLPIDKSETSHPASPNQKRASRSGASTRDRSAGEHGESAEAERLSESTRARVLNLSYSKRHPLINSLSELTSILQCNTTIPDDAKQRTCQKIDQSMRLLVELSPFQPTASTDGDDLDALFEEKIFGQLTAKLSRAERSKAMNHLVDLRDAVLFDRLVSDKTKHNLMAENKRIINFLLDLLDSAGLIA